MSTQKDYFDSTKLDSLFSESTLGFFAREKPNPIDFTLLGDQIQEQFSKENETPVVILRPILFLHSEQPEITFGKLREFFTDKAIKLFEIDGYIKIKK